MYNFWIFRLFDMGNESEETDFYRLNDLHSQGVIKYKEDDLLLLSDPFDSYFNLKLPLLCLLESKGKFIYNYTI